MSTILIKDVRTHRPFSIKQLPFLARLYRRAFRGGDTGRAAFWKSRGLQRLFRLCRGLCRSSTGKFDYERLGRRATIQFNARNLQFQALYMPHYQDGYEPEVAMLLDVLLSEGGTFFDIGSNWGYFTLHAASSHEKLTVHAFEPQPETHRDLLICVEQAGLSDMVTCHQLALSSTDGRSFIQVPDGLHSGQASVSTASGATRIITRRLDAMGLPKPDFIKLDVENHEIEVLRGARETLQAVRPFVVFENKLDDLAPEKILEPLFFLAELGYQLYMPAVQIRHGERCCFMQAGGHPVGEGHLLALAAFKPETRLLLQNIVNVFACHESRLPQMMAMFKPWP